MNDHNCTAQNTSVVGPVAQFRIRYPGRAAMSVQPTCGVLEQAYADHYTGKIVSWEPVPIVFDTDLADPEDSASPFVRESEDG